MKTITVYTDIEETSGHIMLADLVKTEAQIRNDHPEAIDVYMDLVMRPHSDYSDSEYPSLKWAYTRLQTIEEVAAEKQNARHCQWVQDANEKALLQQLLAKHGTPNV